MALNILGVLTLPNVYTPILGLFNTKSQPFCKKAPNFLQNTRFLIEKNHRSIIFRSRFPKCNVKSYFLLDFLPPGGVENWKIYAPVQVYPPVTLLHCSESIN